MKNLRHLLDPETYVRVEKAAKAIGKTVEQWLQFLIEERVGHTQFCPRG